MRICICTTPIRPVPTTFPPFGSMAIIQALRAIGEEVEFYNIDYFRYSREQVEAYFREKQFDLVGISAVVSTAYAYTKYLTGAIKKVSPQTTVVVGGNLAASAEILLRLAKVDYCVAGDGEYIIQDLVRVLRDRPVGYDRLKATKGICFLDENGTFQFTGYGRKPSADEIEWPDYDILEQDGSLSYFVSDEFDNRADGHRPMRPGERMATIVMTKGCVARCTFCHRFEKGFRARPVDQVMEHVGHMREKYNVGFLDVADENFGADRELAHELATRLGEMDVAWRVAGVRTRTVTRESLLHWRANGCASVIYGIESGSPTMLEVMEKNATVEENLNALKWAYEAGFGTVIQLVIAMPGETDKTIHETIEFLKQAEPYMLWWKENLPSEMISINYAQALPGTPLYEYAREQGFIGKTPETEEQYLIRISDTDAYKEDHFVNFTRQPMLKVLMWRPVILAEIDAHQMQVRGKGSMPLLGIVRYYTGLVTVRAGRKLGIKVAHTKGQHDYYTESGYFNIHKGFSFAPLLLHPFTRALFYPLLALAVAVGKARSPIHTLRLLFEHAAWSLTRSFRPPPELPKKSLRKVVKLVTHRNEDAEDRMLPLRSGR